MKRYFAFVLAVMLLCMAGCGGEGAPSQVEANLTDVYKNIEAQLPSMTQMNETMALNFCGLDFAKCKQAVVYVCSDGLRADEIWLIEANDAQTAAQIETLARTRLERKGEESITYSPEQYEVVQKAAVIRNGNYVALVVSPDVDTIASTVRTALGLK